MKSIPSSTGGIITPILDKDGKQIGLRHSAGKAYSGKIAQQEDKVKPAKYQGFWLTFGHFGCIIDTYTNKTELI